MSAPLPLPLWEFCTTLHLLQQHCVLGVQWALPCLPLSCFVCIPKEEGGGWGWGRFKAPNATFEQCSGNSCLLLLLPLSCDLASPGEGFILVNNDEDGQEGESRASGSGSGEDTDGGYRSINGNSSPTVHDVERGASNFRNYGSINRSRSDGRQGDTREPWKWVGSVNGLACSWSRVAAPTLPFALLLLPNHGAKVGAATRD